MTITTKNVPNATGSQMTVVSVNGREVGYVTKFRDTRSSLHPFQAHVGIGHDSHILGNFYTDLQIAKLQMSPQDLDKLRHGGKQAAIHAIVRATVA